MKKFVFNLEKILQLREWNEKEARNRLVEAAGVLSDIENKILKNMEEREFASAENFGQTSVESFTAYNYYLLRLQKEKESLIKEKEAAEIKVEEERENWRNRNSEKSALESLKKRRFEEYKKNVIKEEEKELNDIRPAAKL
ncbi:MAG: flagellar export protein FliJ [Spirochaetaceae bacterium]|nr:flagellar export protein FliJ [Spirochaetaceae bacterium]